MNDQCQWFKVPSCLKYLQMKNSPDYINLFSVSWVRSKTSKKSCQKGIKFYCPNTKPNPCHVLTSDFHICFTN